jgi:hypothetical protein
MGFAVGSPCGQSGDMELVEVVALVSKEEAAAVARTAQLMGVPFARMAGALIRAGVEDRTACKSEGSGCARPKKTSPDLP